MKIEPYTQYNEEEILALYASVGWSSYTSNPQALRSGFEHSLLILTAREKDALLGLIRVVGDGSTIVLVQDLLVHPAHQRQGIGSALLQTILDRFAHIRQLLLITDQSEQTLAFYQSMGLQTLEAQHCCGFLRLQ